MNRNARNRPAHRSHRLVVFLVGIAGVSLLAAVPVVAQAASRSRATSEARQVSARTATPVSSSICSKVSAAAVSAIVGYTVPAATAMTIHAKPTAQNFGVSGLTTLCSFGTTPRPGSTQTAILAALKKDVSLTMEITSRPLTAQEVKTALAKVTSATLHATVTAYSGLGVPALYFTESGGGLNAEGIVGLSGTKYFGASVEMPLSKSKLVALAKLAQTL